MAEIEHRAPSPLGAEALAPTVTHSTLRGTAGAWTSPIALV